MQPAGSSTQPGAPSGCLHGSGFLVAAKQARRNYELRESCDAPVSSVCVQTRHRTEHAIGTDTEFVSIHLRVLKRSTRYYEALAGAGTATLTLTREQTQPLAACGRS